MPVPVVVSLAVLALTVTAASPAQTTAAPKSTSPPTTVGGAEEGQILLASPGEWANNPAQFAYQWQRCDANGAACIDIPAATLGKYTLTAADSGHTVRVTVTASNVDGQLAASSATTATVSANGAPPAPNEAPTIVFLSLRRVRTRVSARFRVCDDSRGAVAITERDTHARALGFTRRFSLTLLTCTTQSRSWVPAARFQARGRYVVTLRAANTSGALSRLVSRSLVF
jgi:hypothetical protein